MDFLDPNPGQYTDYYAASAPIEPTETTTPETASTTDSPPGSDEVTVQEVVVTGHVTKYTFYMSDTPTSDPPAPYEVESVSITDGYSTYSTDLVNTELIKDAVNAMVAKNLPADAAQYEYGWYVYRNPTTGEIMATTPHTDYQHSTVTVPYVASDGTPIQPDWVISSAHTHHVSTWFAQHDIDNMNAQLLAFTPGSAGYNQFSSYVFLYPDGATSVQGGDEYKAGDGVGATGLPVNMGLTDLRIL